MTINGLAKKLCRKEGKAKQVNIAQMSEILAHLSDLFASGYAIDVVQLLLNNGKRRKARRR